MASSAQSAVSVLRVLGASETEEIREALDELGFTLVEPVMGGFEARWHME
jgi:hypothetical protein